MGKIGLRLTWILASVVGTTIGTAVALVLFPGAAVAANPIGRFGWHLVGFALTIGLALGSLQWLVLRYAPWSGRRPRIERLLLWIPATSGGLALMLLPLWWLDAQMLGLAAFAPFEVAGKVVLPMLPGIALLSLTQWRILVKAGLDGRGWIVRTALGLTIGAGVGLLVGLFLARAGATEVVWALCTGLTVGLCQAGALVRGLGPPAPAAADRASAVRGRWPRW